MDEQRRRVNVQENKTLFSRLIELLPPLDSHALRCWLAKPDRSTPSGYIAITDDATRVLVSSASGWELAPEVPLIQILQAFPCRLIGYSWN